MGYLAGIGIAVAAFICLVFVTLAQQLSLKKARQGQNIITFTEYFSGEGIPDYLCREVYRYFQNLLWIRDFPVHPKDDLAKIYGLSDEDIFDTVVALTEVCGYQLPLGKETIGRPIGNIVLVEDLVRFLFFQKI